MRLPLSVTARRRADWAPCATAAPASRQPTNTSPAAPATSFRNPRRSSRIPSSVMAVEVSAGSRRERAKLSEEVQHEHQLVHSRIADGREPRRPDEAPAVPMNVQWPASYADGT